MGWRRSKRYKTTDENLAIKVIAALFIIGAVVIGILWFNTLGQDLFRNRIESR